MTLPSEYQEVEWIQSSGTQYINTWVQTNWNDNTEFEATLKFYKNLNTSMANWKNNAKWLFIGINGSNQFYWWGWLYWGTTSIDNDLAKHTFKVSTSNPNLYIDWTAHSIKVSTSGTIFTWNIAIWGCHSPETSDYWFFCTEYIYWARIWKNWTLVRNFIPCYRKSDGVIWLYDLVNDTFYTNEWTGTFTKWPDVMPVPTYKLHWAIQTFHYQFEVPYSWEPDASRTLIYYPLTSNLADQMWNGNTGSSHWTISFNETTGVRVTWRSWNYVTGMSNGIANRNVFTMNVRAKVDAINNDWWSIVWYTSNIDSSMALKLENRNSIWFGIFYGSSHLWNTVTWDTEWHNFCAVWTWTSYTLYIDNVQVATVSTTTKINNLPELQIWWWWYYGSSRSANGYIKDYIVENYAWSAEDITNYYNRSKSKVWL